MLGRIDVRDSVRRTGKLHLDVFLPIGGSLLLSRGLDRIRNLDDKVKLRRVGTSIGVVKKTQLVDKPLKCRVRLIHNRIKRVLDDGDITLR